MVRYAVKDVTMKNMVVCLGYGALLGCKFVENARFGNEARQLFGVRNGSQQQHTYIFNGW